jgi:hypothetical protein
MRATMTVALHLGQVVSKTFGLALGQAASGIEQSFTQ